MVGRGGGKNVGNHNTDRKVSGGHQNVVVGSRRSLNRVQNQSRGEGHQNVVVKPRKPLIQVQNEAQRGGNHNVVVGCWRPSRQVQNEGNHNGVESLNQMENTQNHDNDMNLSRSQFEKESDGCISLESRGPLGKEKKKKNLVGRIDMALEGLEVTDPPMREGEEEHCENRRKRRRDDHVIGNNGSEHSTVNGYAAQNGEATHKGKKKGERGKYKIYVVDMKIRGSKSKLKVYIPGDINRAIGENARHMVNECGRVVRTRAPLNVKSWKEAFGAVGDVMWREIKIMESSIALLL